MITTAMRTVHTSIMYRRVRAVFGAILRANRVKYLLRAAAITNAAALPTVTMICWIIGIRS
jgi:hypothetical protein